MFDQPNTPSVIGTFDPFPIGSIHKIGKDPESARCRVMAPATRADYEKDAEVNRYKALDAPRIKYYYFVSFD